MTPPSSVNRYQPTYAPVAASRPSSSASSASSSGTGSIAFNSPENQQSQLEILQTHLVTAFQAAKGLDQAGEKPSFNGSLGSMSYDPEKGTVFTLKPFEDVRGNKFPAIVAWVDKENQTHIGIPKENGEIEEIYYAKGGNKRLLEGESAAMAGPIFDRLTKLTGEAVSNMGQDINGLAAKANASVVGGRRAMLSPDAIASLLNSSRGEQVASAPPPPPSEAPPPPPPPSEPPPPPQPTGPQRDPALAQIPTAMLLSALKEDPSMLQNPMFAPVLDELAARMQENPQDLMTAAQQLEQESAQSAQPDPLMAMLPQMLPMLMGGGGGDMSQMMAMLGPMLGGGATPGAGNSNPMMGMLAAMQGGQQNASANPMAAMMAAMQGGQRPGGLPFA